MLGTVVGTIVMCVAQGWLLRARARRDRGRRARWRAALRMLLAAALLGGVSYGVWYGLDSALGAASSRRRSSVLTAIAAGFAVYAAAVWVTARARGAPDPAAADESRPLERVQDRPMPDEKMDVEKQVECLNRALRLQLRSVLQYALGRGSVIGLEYQAHADKMREHATSELEDAIRLVEKVTALGGEPTTDVAPMSFTEPTRRRPSQRLIDERGRDARGAPGGDRADRAARRPRRLSSTVSST